MTDQTTHNSGFSQRGQIGIAMLGVLLCAACGLAWLGGESEPGASFAPSQSVSGTDRPVRAANTDEDVFTAQSAGAQRFAIIVRFENEPVIDEIGRNFRKDPEGSRQQFQQWAAGKPALSGLRLERASYSGEVILASTGGRGMDETIRAIEAMDNVAYVEPDYSAQPSKEG